MKFSAVAAMLLGAVAVSAQSAADLPKCALPCFISNVEKTTGCGLTDTACQCKSENQSKLQTVIAPCVLQACQEADQQKTASTVEAICKAQAGGAQSGAATSGTMMMAATSGAGAPKSSMAATSTQTAAQLGPFMSASALPTYFTGAAVAPIAGSFGAAAAMAAALVL